MNTKNILSKIEKIFGIQCEHKSVMNYNYKFCPDCGKKVTIKHVCVKCMQCGHLRSAIISGAKNISPRKEYCRFCGSGDWTFEYYFDSNIPDKLREISVKLVIEDKDNIFAARNADNFTNIWIEKPQAYQRFRRSNIIKAKKF